MPASRALGKVVKCRGSAGTLAPRPGTALGCSPVQSLPSPLLGSPRPYSVSTFAPHSGALSLPLASPTPCSHLDSPVQNEACAVAGGICAAPFVGDLPFRGHPKPSCFLQECFYLRQLFPVFVLTEACGAFARFISFQNYSPGLVIHKQKVLQPIDVTGV